MVTQSVIALAITVSVANCVDRDRVIETMKSKVPAKVLAANLKAYEIGEKYGKI